MSGGGACVPVAGFRRDEKKQADHQSACFDNGAPGEIRTPDRLVRSQVLYPAELRARYRFRLEPDVGRLVWRARKDSNLLPPGS